MMTSKVQHKLVPPNQQSPHLDSLLSKLRPFQRTAFEFAVHGVLPLDGDDKKGKCDAHLKKNARLKNAAESRVISGSNDELDVAGAGTGRILLGDEMGLG